MVDKQFALFCLTLSHIHFQTRRKKLDNEMIGDAAVLTDSV